MKLAPREARSFFARPDTRMSGVLIYGPDAMRIGLKRQELVAALVGPEGEAEMRFARMTGAELRSDPAQLQDALRASGFFPGQRAVLVEDATDGLAATMQKALEAWAPGDGFLVVTAGQLTPRGGLRKLFEASKKAYAIAVYADPPDRGEIEAMVAKAGLPALGREAMGDVEALSRVLDPGDFQQLLEKLALYTHGQGEVNAEDIAAVAPVSTEADADAVVAAVAGRQVNALPRLMARMAAQGVAPVTLLIAVTRHFRQLHGAQSLSGGASPDEALGRLRPPVVGPRRRVMADQLRSWSPPMLEAALKELMDTDLAIRSARRLPDAAFLERALVRVAMIGARRVAR